MDCAASIFQGRACLCALKKGKKRKENMKSAFKIQLGSNTEQLVPVVNKFFFFFTHQADQVFKLGLERDCNCGTFSLNSNH